MHKQSEIIIKTPKEIENIRKSGKHLTELLEILYDKVKPGVSLIELEFVAQHYITQHHLKGAFKNYDGFPANLCLSVNDCVVHGIPDTYVIKNGDVVKIDCGIVYEWGITDSAITVVAWGELANPLWYELAKVTKKALDEAVKCIHPGSSMYDYAHTVYTTMTNAGFAVIKHLTGHGVGRKVHEKPYIYNFPNTEMKNQYFQPGMVIALEPITAVSSSEFIMKKGQDRNLYTKQWDFWAQWEYTVLITDTGYEILSWMTKNVF